MASYGWKWSLLLFLYAVITVDVLTANNNDVKIGETRTVHFAWLLNRRHVLRELKKNEKKTTNIQILSLVCPPEIPARDKAFIPRILKH